MDQLTDLKAILHSKRANIYYIEKCRVMLKGGRVVYLTEGTDSKDYWNIPIANTTVILLGTGTSITQAAMRMLAQAGVLVGFTGGGGTPLFMGTEPQIDIQWFSPQSEYRPTEYVQGWMSFWFDEDKRLQAAKTFQQERLNYLKKIWAKDESLKSEGFDIDNPTLQQALDRFSARTQAAPSTNDVLLIEAELTKALYKFAANATRQEFTRDTQGLDDANAFLNHGNYLAYGLAATTLWVLGIPHGFAVMHGKTRRGALVFDVADLIKDTLVLPWAFICAKEGMTEQEFRQQCLQSFAQREALYFMFEVVKSIARKTDWEGEP